MAAYKVVTAIARVAGIFYYSDNARRIAGMYRQMFFELAILLLILLLAGAIFVLARRWGRGRVAWVAAILAVALICLIGLANRFPALSWEWPWRWLMTGRREFVLAALALPLFWGIAAGRLRSRVARLGSILMLLAWVNYGVLAFAGPVVTRLMDLPTVMDGSGVCRQQTHFTCGPTAAVTALRQRGIAAETRALALAAHTSPLIGTQADLLADALNRRDPGNTWHVAHSDDPLDHPPDEMPYLVIVEGGFLVHHWVAVLWAHEWGVFLGDPSRGMVYIPRDEFCRQYKGTVILPSAKESRGSR